MYELYFNFYTFIYSLYDASGKRQFEFQPPTELSVELAFNREIIRHWAFYGKKQLYCNKCWGLLRILSFNKRNQIINLEVKTSFASPTSNNTQFTVCLSTLFPLWKLIAF